MYKPKYFQAQELVDPTTFQAFGEDSFQFFNPLLLKAIDALRERMGVPITVNNWWKGGSYHWRGLRTLDCHEGAKWSQHRLGGAVDCNVKGKTADQVRLEIINQKGFGLITCLEADVNWVHLDVRNVPLTDGKLLIVHP